MNADKWFTGIAFIALAVAAVFIEQVNYITTYESLANMFGESRWVLSLSVGVVAADIAGVLRVIFASGKGKKSWKDIGSAMLAVWIAVSAIDVFLNWYFAALEMEANHVVAPSAIMRHIDWFPVIIALFIFGLQFGLIFIITKALENAVNSLPNRARSRNNRPNTQNGAQKEQSYKTNTKQRRNAPGQFQSGGGF